MEYTYSVTTLYDGELVNTLRVSDMLEAVDAWTKCVDFGDAKEYATYNLSDPTGKDQYLTVKEISETKEGFNLVLADDFDDEEEYFVLDDTKIEWYVFVE